MNRLTQAAASSFTTLYATAWWPVGYGPTVREIGLHMGNTISQRRDVPFAGPGKKGRHSPIG